MQEDLVDLVLRFGLYFGAVFQMICVVAVVILPETLYNGIPYMKDTDVSDDDTSDQYSPFESPKKPHAHHKAKKTEKKKRR